MELNCQYSVWYGCKTLKCLSFGSQLWILSFTEKGKHVSQTGTVIFYLFFPPERGDSLNISNF